MHSCLCQVASICETLQTLVVCYNSAWRRLQCTASVCKHRSVACACRGDLVKHVQQLLQHEKHLESQLTTNTPVKRAHAPLSTCSAKPSFATHIHSYPCLKNIFPQLFYDCSPESLAQQPCVFATTFPMQKLLDMLLQAAWRSWTRQSWHKRWRRASSSACATWPRLRCVKSHRRIARI